MQADIELVEKAEVTIKYNIVSDAEDLSRMRTEFDNELLGTYKPGVLDPGIIRAERKFLVPGNQSTKIVFRLEFENRGDVILEESGEYYFESGENKEIYVNY